MESRSYQQQIYTRRKFVPIASHIDSYCEVIQSFLGQVKGVPENLKKEISANFAFSR